MSRSATSEEIRQAYVGKIRQVHPDITGGADHKAKDLNAAYNVLSDPEQRAAYDESLLGNECPWCGARVPPDAVESHVAAHLAESVLNGCQVCGRQPVERFSFKANSGFLLARRVYEVAGNLCSTCATGVFREMQAHNITRGLWGVISLFMAPIYLISNWINYSSNRDGLGPPTPYDQIYDQTTGRGKPVFSRVSVLIVVALLAFVGYSVFQDIQADVSATTPTDSSSTIDVTDPDAGWVVGACADVTGEQVRLTSCTSFADARIVETPMNEQSCPIETDFYVELSRGVACFVEN